MTPRDLDRIEARLEELEHGQEDHHARIAAMEAKPSTTGPPTNEARITATPSNPWREGLHNLFGPRLAAIEAEQDAVLDDATVSEVEKLRALLALSAEMTEYWAARAQPPEPTDFYPTSESIADPEVRRMLDEIALLRAVQRSASSTRQEHSDGPRS